MSVVQSAEAKGFHPRTGQIAEDRLAGDFDPGMEVVGGPAHVRRADGEDQGVADAAAAKLPAERHRSREAASREAHADRG